MSINKEILPRKPIQLATPWAPLPSSKNLPQTTTNSPEAIYEKIRENLPKEYLHTNLQIHSALPQQEAYIKLLQCFPTPGNLKLFEHLLERWGSPIEEKTRFQTATGEKGNPRRPLWIIGDPATGKTSLCRDTLALIFGRKQKDPEGNDINPGPIFYSCGGKNLDELIISKEFNNEGTNSIQALQTKYNENSISPAVGKFLKLHFSELIDQETGAINLENINPTPENLEKIQSIAKIEGVTQSASAIGIVQKPGPAITCALTGRVLVLDEKDKCLEGTGKLLNEFLLVCSGDSREPLHIKIGEREFTIGPNTIHKNFDIVCTSNNGNDTSNPTEFVESYKDRFDFWYLRPPTLEDISIRLCQNLLGFNPWPIYANPSRKKMQEILPALFEQAGHPLSEEEQGRLKELPNTLQAARQMAAFGLACKYTVSNNLINGEDQTLQANANNLPLMGLRWLVSLLRKAIAHQEKEVVREEDIPPAPESLSLQEFMEAFQKRDEKPTTIPLELGEKIAIATHEVIDTFPGGPPIRAEFYSAATLYGILPEIDEEKNENPNKLPTLTTLLSLKKNIEITPETHTLHKQLTEILLQKNPELEGTNKEQLIPLSELQSMINELEKNKESNCIIGLNDIYLQEKTGKPLRLIPIPDIRKLPPNLKIEDFLMTTQEIEAILSHPVLKKTLIENMWDKKPEKTPPEGDDQYPIHWAMTGENPTLRICKVISKIENKGHKKQKNQRDCTILVHSANENKLLAYNPNFRETKDTNAILITNNSSKAQDYIQKTWEENRNDLILLLAHTIQKIDTKTNPSEEDSKFENYIADMEADTNGIQKLLEETCNPKNPILSIAKSPYKGKIENEAEPLLA
jgi:hypothetical protein